MIIFLWIAGKFWPAITHFIKKLSTGQRKGQTEEKGKP
jgi:hypothetical protein